VRVRSINRLLPTWPQLASLFNTSTLAKALDLKCMLTNVYMGVGQFKEDYLRHIKTPANPLAAI